MPPKVPVYNDKMNIQFKMIDFPELQPSHDNDTFLIDLTLPLGPWTKASLSQPWKFFCIRARDCIAEKINTGWQLYRRQRHQERPNSSSLYIRTTYILPTEPPIMMKMHNKRHTW